ncbi:hypothetical protein H0I39_01925 [Ottowia beijingensis]|uniref:Uncharacterized protein n=1 Tax=Ottowia beijingensis TaxID=1207057 RepID=A0A853IW93_9BURK|nr:hypothetical protein [Ottowia beijingensis]NZA00848.1 hypothetical protein [Ottowia beijingensis]
MRTQTREEELSHKLLEHLAKEKPRRAVVALLLAASAIAKACNDNQGVAEIMRVTADHVENDLAVDLVALQ